jgi:hypothetical protein
MSKINHYRLFYLDNDLPFAVKTVSVFSIFRPRGSSVRKRKIEQSM